MASRLRGRGECTTDWREALKLLLATLALVLLPLVASAQRVTVGNITVGDAIAVRCVTANGSTFESCAGAGASVGTVDQGTGGVSPWAVNFLAPQHIICDSGCGTAASVAMADTTANPTIPQASAFGMLFNGVTWDRARGDTTSGAWVNIKNATLAVTNASLDGTTLATIDADIKANVTLHAGTAVIGHVIADTGSTTAVTGNVASTVADGANVTLGAKADAKSTATDTTAVTAMSVLKEISAMEQAPASRAVTNAGTFATQTTIQVGSNQIGHLEANQSSNVAQLAGTATAVNSGLKSDGTLRVVLATDQPALTNKLLVTPDSVALPANQSVNLSQVAATTTDTNSGLKSAGTLRVVLATDQPALTNKLLVTPDSVALPANQSVNTAQFGGTNVSTGAGAGGAGIPRVTISNDSSLAANQSVNVAQINGVATSMGVGASGTGTQRVASVIHDGTDTAQVTATSGGSLQVECAAGCSAPATTNFFALAGQESVASPTAATWYLRKQWALPSNAHFYPTAAWATITTALTKTLVAIINNLGNLNLGTNVYTAGNSVASPFAYSRLFGCVTTVMSATVDTITPTYTDELGNSQATAGVVFASASPQGNCFEFALAASAGPILDSGVRAVTTAVDTAATTGVVTFFGVTTVADFAGTAANQTESLAIPDTGELNANEQLAIFMMQAAVTAQLKTFGVSGKLR